MDFKQIKLGNSFTSCFLRKLNLRKIIKRLCLMVEADELTNFIGINID
jgi:hypothetical protein